MKPTILLLEDEAFDQDWLSKILEEEGYTVSLATNGDEIKKKIDEEGGNIVMAVLDMKILVSNAAENFGEEIPNRRGVAAAKYIQHHLGAIPVIFASAFGKEGVKEIAEAANYTGPWAYFDKHVLRDRQSTVLREAVRLAIQSQEEYTETASIASDVEENEDALLWHSAAELSFHEGRSEKYLFRFKVYNNLSNDDDNSRRGDIVDSHDYFTTNASSFIQVCPSDICFLVAHEIRQITQQDKIRFILGLKSGEEFVLYISMKNFDTLYENWTKNGMPDFLLEGAATRLNVSRRAYINPDNVLRYAGGGPEARGMVIFNDSRRYCLEVSSSLYQNLKRWHEQQRPPSNRQLR